MRATTHQLLTAVLVIALMSAALLVLCADARLPRQGPVGDLCGAMSHSLEPAPALVGTAFVVALSAVAVPMGLGTPIRPGHTVGIIVGSTSRDAGRSFEERSMRLRL